MPCPPGDGLTHGLTLCLLTTSVQGQRSAGDRGGGGGRFGRARGDDGEGKRLARDAEIAVGVDGADLERVLAEAQGLVEADGIDPRGWDRDLAEDVAGGVDDLDGRLRVVGAG